MSKRVTKAQAEKVLRAVKRQFRPWVEDDNQPKLVMDWNWTGKPSPAIVWEEGPFEWALDSTGGGFSEFGFKISPLDQPDGVFCEPVTSWALGVYPDEPYDAFMAENRDEWEAEQQ